MEKHIFKFGENSVAIIVPKKWIEKNGLKPSSSVFVSENETGSLVISTSETLKAEADKTVVPRSSAFALGRWVGLHYMYGTSKLHIHSEEGLTSSQVQAVGDKISAECPGFEVTKQSNKDMIIEDLTNVKEIGLGKIITRLHSLIKEEFREVKEGDPRTISKIEKLVNRFYMLGIRYVNTTQPRDAQAYATHLKLLEFISDIFELLASSINIKGMKVFEDLGNQFDECTKAIDGDADAADHVLAMRDSMVREIQHMKVEKIYKYLLTSIADNTSNIAELCFRQYNPTGNGKQDIFGLMT